MLVRLTNIHSASLPFETLRSLTCLKGPFVHVTACSFSEHTQSSNPSCLHALSHRLTLRASCDLPSDHTVPGQSPGSVHQYNFCFSRGRELLILCPRSGLMPNSSRGRWSSLQDMNNNPPLSQSAASLCSDICGCVFCCGWSQNSQCSF